MTARLDGGTSSIPMGVMATSTKYSLHHQSLFSGIDILYDELMKKAEGVYNDAGYKDVVMHPDLPEFWLTRL